MIGDRFRIGDVLLEATAPRNPCNTFAVVMGDRRWVKRFHEAQRPGVYARVLEPGDDRGGRRGRTSSRLPARRCRSRT